LVDSEGISQVDAAKKMKISQSTLSRLLKDGRKKLVDGIVGGHAIKIKGGNFKMARGGRFGTSAFGKGRMRGGFSEGPGGFCVCPNCGSKVSHVIGAPCFRQKCSKCGSKMLRANFK